MAQVFERDFDSSHATHDHRWLTSRCQPLRPEQGPEETRFCSFRLPLHTRYAEAAIESSKQLAPGRHETDDSFFFLEGIGKQNAILHILFREARHPLLFPFSSQHQHQRSAVDNPDVISLPFYCHCLQKSLKKPAIYFLREEFSLRTFLTIFCSSMRKARTTRSLTQLAQREPP